MITKITKFEETTVNGKNLVLVTSVKANGKTDRFAAFGKVVEQARALQGQIVTMYGEYVKNDKGYYDLKCKGIYKASEAQINAYNLATQMPEANAQSSAKEPADETPSDRAEAQEISTQPMIFTSLPQEVIDEDVLQIDVDAVEEIELSEHQKKYKTSNISNAEWLEKANQIAKANEEDSPKDSNKKKAFSMYFGINSKENTFKQIANALNVSESTARNYALELVKSI